MITVLFETSVLSGGHSARGIGAYARFLLAELEKIPELTIQKTTDPQLPAGFKPDLVHYPFFDFFFDTLPLNPLTKKVVTIHDVIPLLYPEYYQPGIKGKLRLQKQLLALKTAKAIITDSESSKIDIIRLLGVTSNKIHVIPLAANPELEPQTEQSIAKIRRKYAVPIRYLLYVGDINYNKNIPQLIKMLKFLPDSIKLVCVGRNFREQDIPEWHWIETQLALSGVEKRVLFISELLTDATTDLAALYSGALAYIQPSLYEGFGLPILEAMTCRVPVVSAHNSSLVELGGERVVFAENTTAESLALAVEEVLNWSNTKRSTVARQAARYAKEYNWSKTAAKTAAVYKKIVTR